MAKKKVLDPVEKLRCACGRSINLIKQEDGSYKCTACLADEDEKRRHGMPLTPPEPPEPQNPTDEE